jgi:propanediol dehydratase large subunit
VVPFKSLGTESYIRYGKETPVETAIQTTAHPGLSSKETARKLALIEHGARLVISVAQQCGYTGPTDNLLEGKTWSELRDDMYDEMLDAIKGR